MKRPPANRLAISILLMCIGGASVANAGGDPVEGEALARQWCDGCHLSSTAKTASDVGPPFGQIAIDPKYTDARLRGWLHDPHPPMPKFELDRRRIDNIVAYIRSLKR